MINWCKLENASVYSVDDKFYIMLEYRYEDNDGVHELTIPKVDFPFKQDKYPVFYRKEANGAPYILANDHVIPLLKGQVGDAYEYAVDVIVEPAVHEMTIDEIEKKLGYKVKVVTKEENNET